MGTFNKGTAIRVTKVRQALVGPIAGQVTPVVAYTCPANCKATFVLVGVKSVQTSTQSVIQIFLRGLDPVTDTLSASFQRTIYSKINLGTVNEIYDYTTPFENRDGTTPTPAANPYVFTLFPGQAIFYSLYDNVGSNDFGPGESAGFIGYVIEEYDGAP